MTPRHALIVDDDALARAWLQRALAQAFPQAAVALAGSVQEGRRAIEAQRPDLALIDLDLPDGSGVALIEQLAQLPQRTISVVSTVFADDEHLFPALRAGATSYLLKDDAIEHMAELLRHVVQGRPALSAPIAQRLIGYFHAPPATSAHEPLSQREAQVLKLLAKGMTIGEVAGTLSLTAHTVSSYTKALYRKLNVTNRAEATLEAARRGLIEPWKRP
jgi:DNA-binding NarL/FixJ family response regulator